MAIARGLYADKDVYLMDDIFSALDKSVKASIFESAILGILRNKTRILVTHEPYHLEKADRVIVLSEGKIIGQGKLKEVNHLLS